MIVHCFSEAEAREIMAGRVLGKKEAEPAWWKPFNPGVPFPETPEVPYSRECLDAHRATHILVFGFPRMPDGKPFSIVNLYRWFNMRQNGICFSSLGLSAGEENEWTLRPPRRGWWLIRKEVYPDGALLGASCIACDAFAEASGWKVPYVADAVYAAAFWQLVTGERLLRHHCTWCADVLPDGRRLRVGYNQPPHGFHLFSRPADDRNDGDRGLMPIVPPDLQAP